MGNVKRFEILRDVYYYLSLPTTDIIGRTVAGLTGFGDHKSCTICDDLKCVKCEWMLQSGTTCVADANHNTYEQLYHSKNDFITFINVAGIKQFLRERANLMSRYTTNLPYLDGMCLDCDLSPFLSVGSPLFTVTSVENDCYGTGESINEAVNDYNEAVNDLNQYIEVV